MINKKTIHTIITAIFIFIIFSHFIPAPRHNDLLSGFIKYGVLLLIPLFISTVVVKKIGQKKVTPLNVLLMVGSVLVLIAMIMILKSVS